MKKIFYAILIPTFALGSGLTIEDVLFSNNEKANSFLSRHSAKSHATSKDLYSQQACIEQEMIATKEIIDEEFQNRVAGIRLRINELEKKNALDKSELQELKDSKDRLRQLLRSRLRSKKKEYSNKR